MVKSLFIAVAAAVISEPGKTDCLCMWEPLQLHNVQISNMSSNDANHRVNL